MGCAASLDMLVVEEPLPNDEREALLKSLNNMWSTVESLVESLRAKNSENTSDLFQAFERAHSLLDAPQTKYLKAKSIVADFNKRLNNLEEESKKTVTPRGWIMTLSTILYERRAVNTNTLV